MKTLICIAALVGCVLLLSQCNEYVPTSAPHIDMSTPQQLAQAHEEALKQIQRHRQFEWAMSFMKSMFWFGIPAIAIWYWIYLNLKRQAHREELPAIVKALPPDERAALLKRNDKQGLLTHTKDDEDKP